MQFKRLHSLRIFILLLLTVFFIDTVYASGMMIADQLSDNHHTSIIKTHNHDDHGINQHENHQHEAGQEQSTNDLCSECGHCMACFTVLPPSQLDKMQSQPQATEISLFEPSYHSHISAQPQRPPIS